MLARHAQNIASNVQLLFWVPWFLYWIPKLTHPYSFGRPKLIHMKTGRCPGWWWRPWMEQLWGTIWTQLVRFMMVLMDLKGADVTCMSRHGSNMEWISWQCKQWADQISFGSPNDAYPCRGHVPRMGQLCGSLWIWSMRFMMVFVDLKASFSDFPQFGQEEL